MNTIQNPSLFKLKEELSEDLLVIISMNDDDATEAELAFLEFYDRFKDYIWKHSYKISRGVICVEEDLSKAIFNNTFNVVYNKADKYDSSRVKSDNPEIKIEIWLGGIIKNQYKKLITNYYGEGVRDSKEKYESILKRNGEEFELPLSEKEENTSKYSSIENDCFEKGIQRLGEKEKDILFTYYRFKDGRKQLPEDELNSLKSLYNTTSENLRQIKGRAFKKLKKFVEKCAGIDIN